MLHFLRGGNQREIGAQLLLVRAFFDGFLPLFDEALHRPAGLGLGFGSEQLESLVEPLHLHLRLQQVFFESLTQLRSFSGARHLGERRDQLIFSVKQILKFLDE